MKKLLIVVDFQNDFVIGTLGFEKAKDLEDVIYQKIKYYQDNNYDVIYTLDTHYDNYLETLEGKYLPIKHCIKDTAGHEVYGKVKELLKDRQAFYKNSFPSLELANYLKDKDYDEVEVCGLVSNICVLSNAILVRAALPEAKIIIDKTATASYDETLNEKTFDVMKGLYFEVIEGVKYD